MMIRRLMLAASTVAVLATGLATPAAAESARKMQEKKTAELPTCTRKLGTIAVVEPDNNWWQALGLGSPEAIIKMFVMKSGCFGMVDRNKGLSSRNIERALADQGELQQNSNIGRAQVKAADYFIVPDIVTKNNNAGGMNIGGALGGMFGGWGGVVGGLSVKKKEANVMLTLVNARTTEQERMSEGFAKKQDIGFSGGGWGGGWGGWGGAEAGGYANTDIGQVIVLAYLDAYTRLVRDLGGLPENASAAAPQAAPVTASR